MNNVTDIPWSPFLCCLVHLLAYITDTPFFIVFYYYTDWVHLSDPPTLLTFCVLCARLMDFWEDADLLELTDFMLPEVLLPMSMDWVLEALRIVDKPWGLTGFGFTNPEFFSFSLSTCSIDITTAWKTVNLSNFNTVLGAVSCLSIWDIQYFDSCCYSYFCWKITQVGPTAAANFTPVFRPTLWQVWSGLTWSSRVCTLTPHYCLFTVSYYCIILPMLNTFLRVLKWVKHLLAPLGKINKK